ncbi:hypothetical protein F511_03567 [Dorcoceras hygrometricum]|uniref:Uncharacterized protein n=1 Tax=Dorcoceras hygrometricum TaxID=472368 RepID=A0A2Z7B0P3_9LAMI|nr:hypothetical protein F511_03567 [Dorcoceras hygrometricum]
MTRRIRSCQNPSDLLVQIDGGIMFPVVDLIRRSTAAYLLKYGFLVKLVGAKSLDASKETGSGSAIVANSGIRAQARILQYILLPELHRSRISILENKKKISDQPPTTRHAAAPPWATARARSHAGQHATLHAGQPPCAIVAHGGVRWMLPPRNWLRDGRQRRARETSRMARPACDRVPHASLAAAATVQPPSGDTRGNATAVLSSRFGFGPVPAAHEVFGPIFDIGPILVGPKLILKILRFWA